MIAALRLGQVERGERPDELEDEHAEQQPAVRAQQAVAEQPDQHGFSSVGEVGGRSRAGRGRRCGRAGRAVSSPSSGWVSAKTVARSTVTASWAGTRRWAASGPIRSSEHQLDLLLVVPLACAEVVVGGACRARRRRPSPVAAAARGTARTPAGSGPGGSSPRRPAAPAAAGPGRWRRIAARVRASSKTSSTHGVDELVLGRERPEDRPLGDAGRLGDLAGADVAAVALEQRLGRADQRGASVLEGHRGGSGHDDETYE